jgi:hypothetical protein
MLIFKTLSPIVKKDRSPVSPDNPFTALEKSVSESIVTLLDNYQNIRDHFDETMFFTIYENPWMKLLYPGTSRKKKPEKEQEKEKAEEDALTQKETQHWVSGMEKGGYEEGIIRIVMALEDSDHAIDRDALYKDERLLESSARFKKLNKKGFLHIVGEQSRILQVDEEKALKALGKLIVTQKDRQTALTLARKIVSSGSAMTSKQKAVLSRIKKNLTVN